MTLIQSIPRYRRIHKKPGYVGTESYGGTAPGDCLCTHRLSHHAPEAVGRACERSSCGCQGFVSASGVQPHIDWSPLGWRGQRNERS